MNQCGIVSSNTNSPLMPYVLEVVEREHALFATKYTDWAEKFDTEYHITNYVGEGTTSNYYGYDSSLVIYTKEAHISTMCNAPINEKGEHLEKETDIWDEIMSMTPSMLERFGDTYFENDDVTALDELVKMMIITCAMTEEKLDGESVTWHTNPSDDVYLSYSHQALLEEGSYYFGKNGENMNMPYSDWVKNQDISLYIAYDDSEIPFIWTDHESTAYRLQISNSKVDKTAVPKADPTPIDITGETKYEYYAFDQDITGFDEFLLMSFSLLLEDEEEVLSVGDSITWHFHSDKAPSIEVNQDSHGSFTAVKEAFTLVYEQYLKPSASSLLQDTSFTLEVDESDDGSLFYFVDHELLASVLYLPVNAKEEYPVYGENMPYQWLEPLVPEEKGWWEDMLATSEQQTDFSAANELAKICTIIAAIAEESLEGVSVTWHTNLTEDEGEILTVEGGSEEICDFVESELLAIVGDHFPLAVSEAAKEVPFVLTFVYDEDGVPRIYGNEIFWTDVLYLPLLGE